MTPTQALQQAIEENTKQVASLSQMMALYNLKQEGFEKLVAKHDVALYGTDERKGLIQRFDITEDKINSTQKNISAIVGAIIGAFFSAVGIWLWQTFLSGLTK